LKEERGQAGRCVVSLKEADVTYVNAKTARIGFVTLAVTILTAGFCGDASAKAHKGRLPVSNSVYESNAQLVSPQQPAQLGQMRYYGGPKSPMWREVR
jgi:hypothetical protein